MSEYSPQNGSGYGLPTPPETPSKGHGTTFRAHPPMAPMSSMTTPSASHPHVGASNETQDQDDDEVIDLLVFSFKYRMISVRKKVLLEASPYFRAALTGGFVESRTKSLDFSLYEWQTMKWFLDYLQKPGRIRRVPPLSRTGIMELYCLANEVLCPGLQNTIIRALQNQICRFVGINIGRFRIMYDQIPTDFEAMVDPRVEGELYKLMKRIKGLLNAKAIRLAMASLPHDSGLLPLLSLFFSRYLSKDALSAVGLSTDIPTDFLELMHRHKEIMTDGNGVNPFYSIRYLIRTDGSDRKKKED